MARGRKPDGPALQAAKGNPGRRKPKPPVEIAPVAVGAIRPPKWVAKSPRAVAVWNDLVPMLARLNLVTELDAYPLARYCRYLCDWVTADEAVRKEGSWFDTVGTNGEPTKKRHPAFHARTELEKSLREIEEAFGARPDARYKILRDQAAAMGAGNLPLFGDGAERSPGMVAGRKDPGEVEPAPAEIVGILGQFDSNPPGRPN